MPLRAIIHIGAFGCDPSRHLEFLPADEKAPAAASPRGLGLSAELNGGTNCLQIVISL
jgi:hypothetical protein